MTLTGTYLTATAALTNAAVGGLFLGFSTFVMRGLDRAEPAAAISAMQGINVEAERSAPFLILFFGSAVLALIVGIRSALHLREPGSGYLVAGAALCILAVVVTVAVNVPLNNALALADPAAPESARTWADYATSWTMWNHVRTVAPLLGSALLLTGIRSR